jgi:PEP-CTERM motif
MKYNTSRLLPIAAVAVMAVASATANAAVAITSTNAGNTDVPFPFSLGFVFTVGQNMNLTALGQFDVAGNGTVGTAKVALYNWDTGTKITESTLTGGALEETGVYDTYFVDIPTIVLSTGTNYLLATEVTSNDFVYGSNIMSVDSNVNWLAGRATGVGSPAMPGTANVSTFSIERTTEDDGSYFGPNMKVTAIPEPSAALLGGLGMLAWLRRRRMA